MSEKTFTEALNNLQKAAAAINNQSTTLEDSLRLFDEGMREAEFCQDILDQAEQKITMYMEGMDIDA